MRLSTILHALALCANLALAACSAGHKGGSVTVGVPGAEPTTSDAPVTMVKSRTFDLRSEQGRTYRIFIAEPVRPAPSSGAPVIYVLDANAMFFTMAEAARFQKNLVPAVVVGIGYPTEALLDPDRRYWDYTPSTPVERLPQSPNEPAVKPGGTGGQDEFLRFIQNVVKPEVVCRCTIDQTQQIIFGHSLAGRFVLHVLFTHPESFSTYIAASPSIWWDNASVLDEAGAFISSSTRTPTPPSATARSLLLTFGEMEQKVPPGTPKERAMFLTRARMADNARGLAERLRPLGDAALRVLLVEFPGENHGSVVPFAVSRSLRFALPAATPPAKRTP